jgi:hypothetical protein
VEGANTSVAAGVGSVGQIPPLQVGSPKIAHAIKARSTAKRIKITTIHGFLLRRLQEQLIFKTSFP